MADDLFDLGTTPLFVLQPDWAGKPSFKFDMLRKVINYGSASELYSLNVEAPHQQTVSFTFEEDDHNTFLDFMLARRGRNERFWFMLPKRMFTLQQKTLAGQFTLQCERNDFNLMFQGHERIYIEMNNGDIITRKISSVTENIVSDKLDITVADQFDRDISEEDVIRVGKLILCRFDSDDFEINAINRNLVRTKMKVLELLKEYDDV